MDGPTWWNNRLWRTGSLREDRPSSASSQRLSAGHNLNSFNQNASSQQVGQSTFNVHPGQTSTYTIPPRQREKKLIRPNFRPSTPKREGRPLAAMRFNFFNGNSSNEDATFSTAPQRSGTPSNPFNRANTSMSSVVYGRSLTPSPMSNYTVYSRPNSVGVVYPKPQPSVINTPLSSSMNHRHDDMGIPTNENYHSLQNISLIASNGNPNIHSFRTPSKELTNKPSNSPVTFIRNGIHPVSSQPAVMTSLNEHSAATGVANNNTAFPASSVIQSRQNVIASRFGRRVLRPNTSVVSNDDDNYDDTNDTSSTHSSAVIHNNHTIAIPHETQSYFSSKDGTTKSSTSNSTINKSTTISSKPPLPSSSGSIQKSSADPEFPGPQTTLSNSDHVISPPSNTYTNSMAIIRGNLWQGNSKLKELVLVPSQNGKLESKPPQIQETYPVRTPLKSILKKSNSFINGLTQQQQGDCFSGIQSHSQDEEAHKDNGPSLTIKQLGNHSSLSLSHGSKENLPQNVNTHATVEDRGLHQSILLRRSLQSAPSLKRAVRFNMGQNAVLEFHATENHFSNDDGDFL